MRHLVENKGLAEKISIESAGTGDWHVGELADPRSRTAGQTRGYVFDRRARHFDPAFFDRYDYVLAADEANRRHLQGIAKSAAARAKIHLLRDFDPASPKGSEVPDPYYGGAAGFDVVLDVCEAACRGLLAHLAEALEER
jgi:protein-tyrosine phosphatase